MKKESGAGKSAEPEAPRSRGTSRALVIAAGLAAVGLAIAFYLRVSEQRKAPVPAETQSPTSTAARFTGIEGSVKVKAVGTFEWVAADKNITLKRSDLVRTGPGSSAEITFFDGTVVHVRPDSLITIEESVEDPSTKQRRVAWHISSGEVNFRTVRHAVPGGATEVSTPTVRGTVGDDAAANIRVAESGDSDIRLFRGATRVRTKTGEQVQLSSNEGLKVDASGKAGAKVNLPAAPSTLAPQDRAVLAYLDPARSATPLVWKAVAEAAAYHVVLDATPGFGSPSLERREVKGTSQELRGLEQGQYYWRVAAVDKDGNEGGFSETASFTVSRAEGPPAAAPPPLALEALEARDNILQIKGRTAPGASLTVNGHRLEVQPDGSFNEALLLERRGKQTVVVKAVGADGGVAELRRDIVAAGG